MTKQRIPFWYWIAGVILLLWSLAGIGAFVAQFSMGPVQLAQLPEAQRNAFMAMPNWAWTAYAIATVSALAAAICLLLRRAWAVPLYAVSLAAVVAQFGWTFLVFRITTIMSAKEAVPFPALIILMGCGSLWFANRARRRGWAA